KVGHGRAPACGPRVRRRRPLRAADGGGRSRRAGRAEGASGRRRPPSSSAKATTGRSRAPRTSSAWSARCASPGCRTEPLARGRWSARTLPGGRAFAAALPETHAMKLQKIYAALLTADLAAAEGWYTKLLGRGPDNRPMDTLVQWELFDG